MEENAVYSSASTVSSAFGVIVPQMLSNEIDQTELLQPLINSRNFQSAQYNFHLLHIVYLNTNILFCFTLIFVTVTPNKHGHKGKML